ncbi:MAG: serine/threonine-protein kinase, partial [Myxococcales bacterium]|nr:serine/threonine-protein kinase [Myxococcales bacterium]
MSEPRLPSPGEVVAAKYRVEAAIGAGGMGAVYRARHERTGKAVALKWLQPELARQERAAKRFIREARASARIRHPNVVDIYDVEEQDGHAFLVMELLEGETLRDLLRARRLSIDECLALLVPAMRGVAAAHARGVVHRDIKPDNLFIARHADDAQRSVPKVLDFGISKVAADTPLAEGTLTATGAILGTPHYMSLEQLQGEEVDARSDIYAFGVVLYECLVGERPFDGESFSAIVVKVATETPVDPCKARPELPAGPRDVVLNAMARAREARP